MRVKMKTRVSVIISLNRERRYLEDCIDSVLEQSINDLELTEDYERNVQVILVDNPNHTSEIAQRYARDYSNVEYLCGKDHEAANNLNYASEFAQGDYIIFLDSNVKLTPKAFEMMYIAAIRDDSEMVTGNVLFFNSKNYSESPIHVKAFSGNKQISHITESPELLYDATMINKLFKRSFWKEHEFQFSKQIAYDDLLAFRCHFHANKISRIFEDCFIWIVFNGIPHSSNSSGNETENLMDRLSVLRSLDDYFKENIENDLLNETRRRKCLSYDLPSLINSIRDLDEDDSKIFMDLLNDYIKTNVDVEDFKCLDEFDKLKYEYLIDNDYEKLMALLNFQSDELSQTRMYLKDSHIMIDVDEAIFKKSSVSIDKFIERQRKTSFIQQVKFRANDILVKGLAFIPGLKVESFDDIEYSFYLFNSLTQRKIDLKYKQVKIGNFDSITMPYGEDFSYEASGYEVYIPYSVVGSDFLGENRIVVNFKQNGIDQTFFAGQAQQKIMKKSNLKVKLIENKYFIFKYSPLNDLIIDLSYKDRYSNISFEDNKLSIDSSDYNRDLFLFYPKDSINNEKYIPLTFNNENNSYSIDIDDLSKSEGILTYSNGEPIVCDSKEILYFHSDKGQCVIDTKRDHLFKIDKHDNITLVSHVFEKDNVFTLDAKLHHLPLDMEKLKSATLYLKDNKTMELSHVSEGIISKDGNVKFKLDMSKEEYNKNLYHGYHNVYARYDFGDAAFSTSVQLLNPFSKRFSLGDFSYRVYRGNGNLFRIQVKRQWDFIQNSPRKRQFIKEKIYKLFRKFTRINSKRIVFESMAGEKYSCNPRYLYEFIDENHPEYECIWSMKDEHTPINGNAKRVRTGSMKYYYYLATSKYLIDNIAFSPDYIKRKGQKVIQTMHGTPLKTLGLDAPGYYLTEESRNNALRRWSYWDYLTVQSEYVSKIVKRCFRYGEKLLNFGYPRTDILYTKNNKEDIDRIKEKLGIPLDKKVILYAPTFRVEKEFDLKIDLNSFKKSLSDDYVFILRLHHLSSGYKHPKNEDFVYDLSKYESSEELYLISDILITDYSSVMFDYAILDRPILLFTYDLDIYRDELRGFYTDIVENRPGPILYTSKEVENAIINIDEVEEETKHLRRKFSEEFNQFENANSSEQIFNTVFK